MESPKLRLIYISFPPANHATLLEGRSADERLENEILEEDLGGTSHNRTAEADQQDPYVMGYFLTMPGKEPR